MVCHSSLSSFSVFAGVTAPYLIPFCSIWTVSLCHHLFSWLAFWAPFPCFQALIKQDNLDAFNERDPYKADDAREEEEENDDDNSLEGETFPLERDEVMPPPLQHPQTDRLTCPKGLPWAPKVRWVSSSRVVLKRALKSSGSCWPELLCKVTMTLSYPVLLGSLLGGWSCWCHIKHALTEQQRKWACAAPV